MKNVKSFMLILISTALVGMLIFCYAIGIDAFAGVKRSISDIKDIKPPIEKNIHYGYVNKNKVQIPLPDTDTAINQYAADLLDSITQQISGMTVDDMHKDLDKKLQN